MTATAGADLTEATQAAEMAARASYGRLVAILASRSRDIAAAEDALADAFLAALRTWPSRGVPANPDGWLLTAARNRQRNAARHGGVRARMTEEVTRRLEEMGKASRTPPICPTNGSGFCSSAPTRPSTLRCARP
jgi:RNA polymerase sigma-70 factor (ECF subfamily)